MNLKALIIGCGNIGGMYDINNDFVQTHAKAISLSEWISSIDIFDLNTEFSNKISVKYGFNNEVGLLVNCSRDILYASNGLDFSDAASLAAQKIQQEMSTFMLNI